ncbi:MAG: hypothetical protein KAJ95_06905, partial [Gammaproteobacteria bacterium]|nr:hypothetical protein [Gammaproteobacteria bacterium]
KTLLNWWLLRELVFEVTLCPPPDLKKREWSIILDKLTDDIQEIHPPEDASTSGMMIEMLMEFLQKAKIDGEDEDRQRLLRGVPVVTTITHEQQEAVKYVVFRMRDFVSFLKKQRFEEFKGSKLYIVLKDCGLMTNRLKVGNTVISVWGMPTDKFKERIKPIDRELEY